MSCDNFSLICDIIYCLYINIYLLNYSNTADAQFLHIVSYDCCIFLITEWSGGGQLSQFCCKSTVLYYYDYYPQYYFNDQEKIYRESSDKNFFDYWDHYTPNKCKRIFLNKDEFENIHLLKKICLT